MDFVVVAVGHFSHLGLLDYEGKGICWFHLAISPNTRQ
jgi:hypothetical protein